MGASFGIMGLRHYDIDIAMPRSEKATGRGHRDFEVFVDPFIGEEKAALRRDFTMNALMQDVLTGEILDFFGGRADLAARRIRHVSDASFAEDPLRVLRGAQFAARFNLEPDEETLDLMRRMPLDALSSARVYGEMKKAVAVRLEGPSLYALHEYIHPCCHSLAYPSCTHINRLFLYKIPIPYPKTLRQPCLYTSSNQVKQTGNR